MTLRYRFRDAAFEAAEEPFEADGHKSNRGSFIVRNVPQDELAKPAPSWACGPTRWPPHPP